MDFKNFSEEEGAASAIHGGYETKNRINSILWNINKANERNSHDEVYRHLKVLFQEAVILLNEKQYVRVLKQFNQTTESYNNLGKGGDRKEYVKQLFNMEMLLRRSIKKHIMPSSSDPNFALME